MKIKTLEKLEDKIDQDFSWRKFELLKLKLALKNSHSLIGRETLIRSSIALLCAHWEGFIRSVANYYVVYICNQKLNTNLLTDNFFVFLLKKDIINTGKSSKNSVHTRLLEKIDEKKKSTFYLKYNDVDGERIINTQSNLNYDLFVEILKSININNIYQTKENYIDSEMLKMRHAIVHGERINLDEYDFDETYDQVMGIMEDFKQQVLVAAESKIFLKS